jgi:hypothetical protein
MTQLNVTAALVEAGLRLDHVERRASLLASLGPLPKPERVRPFARRVVPLLHVVEVQHPMPELTAYETPRAA